MNSRIFAAASLLAAMSWPLAASAEFFSEALIDWSRLELGCVDTNLADGIPCNVSLNFTSFDVNANAGAVGDSDVADGAGIALQAFATEGGERAEAAAGDSLGITRSYVRVDPYDELATPYAESNTHGTVRVTGGYATIKLPIFIEQNTVWPPASHNTRILFNEEWSSVQESDYHYASGFIERDLLPDALGVFNFHAQASSFLYVSAVPETETYALLGMGMAAIGLAVRRHKRHTGKL